MGAGVASEVRRSESLPNETEAFIAPSCASVVSPLPVLSSKRITKLIIEHPPTLPQRHVSSFHTAVIGAAQCSADMFHGFRQWESSAQSFTPPSVTV